MIPCREWIACFGQGKGVNTEPIGRTCGCRMLAARCSSRALQRSGLQQQGKMT
jgi:hypothetical protein